MGAVKPEDAAGWFSPTLAVGLRINPYECRCEHGVLAFQTGRTLERFFERLGPERLWVS